MAPAWPESAGFGNQDAGTMAAAPGEYSGQQSYAAGGWGGVHHGYRVTIEDLVHTINNFARHCAQFLSRHGDWVPVEEEESPAPGEAPSDDLPNPIEYQPPELHNPLGDDAEPAYTRRECGDVTIYEYASAGAIVQKAGRDETQWDKLKAKNDKEFGGNLYGRWGSKQEEDDAKWMASGKISQASLTELLKTERFAKNPPKFKNIKKLNKIIEKELGGLGGPKFKPMKVELPEANQDHQENLDFQL
ncbi:hypothetical protein FRC09_006133 [Ceratobasidium sp. 395]|nr:hypothetical protein FRC09_006133 [Ceratobasidium sp. 395]